MEQNLLLITIFGIHLGYGYLLYLNNSKLLNLKDRIETLLNKTEMITDQNQDIMSKNDCLLSEIKDNLDYDNDGKEPANSKINSITTDQMIEMMESDLSNESNDYSYDKTYFDEFYDNLYSYYSEKKDKPQKRDIKEYFYNKNKPKPLRM